MSVCRGGNGKLNSIDKRLDDLENHITDMENRMSIEVQIKTT